MKAVFIRSFGGPENIEIRDVPAPAPAVSTQVLVRVRAAGLNRADLLQRRGLYPPPQGYSPQIPGLEFAGEVEEVGRSVGRWKTGDRVFGITAGEAQAERVVVDERLIAPIPDALSFAEAAAVPEAFITAYDAVFTQAGLSAGETLLVHAVGSGVGLAAVQLARAFGARTIGTSRTAGKLERAREFGLDEGILTGENAAFGAILRSKNGRGADVILDLVGAAYFAENIDSLMPQGRLVLAGLTSGRKAEFDLGLALTKRLKIIGTILRSRTVEEKAAAVREFENNVLPLLGEGRIRANVDRVFPAARVGEAHEHLESNASFGKVVLEF